jgi:hypothetical protein
MKTQLDRIETPKPVNGEISIDLSSFYEFGNYASTIQEKYKDDKRRDVNGFYIKGNAYGVVPSKCKKIDKDEDRTSGVFKNLKIIADFCESKNLNAFLIEFSIYDARDTSGNKFYTYIYSQSSSLLKVYLQEVQNNIDSDKPGRGIILPSNSFYAYPYFVAKSEKKSSFKTLNFSSSKPFLFVGSFSPTKDDSLNHDEIRENTVGFINCILEKQSKEKSLVEDKELLIGIVIPIIRPVRIPQTEQDEEDDEKDLCRYNGGGLFIYGVSGENFKVDEFVLRMKTDLLEKALMKESFSATDHHKNSRITAVNDFSHEMKHVLSALQGKWLREAEDIFDIDIYDKERPTGNQKIGRIEVYDRNMLKALRIAPFPEFVENISNLGFLWTGSYNPLDLPFEIIPINNEVLLSEVIQSTWDFMIKIAVTSLLYKSEPKNKTKIELIKKNYDDLVTIFPRIEVLGEENFKKKPVIKWGERLEISKSMSLIRIFASLFSNATKSMDVSQKYIVELYKYENDDIRVVLKNNKKPKNIEDIDYINQVAERLHRQSRMENYTIEEIKASLSVMQDLKLQSEHVGIGDHHTDNVIDGLKKYAGVYSFINDSIDENITDKWKTEMIIRSNNH